jgi:ParB family chromosome partitioning protein
MARTSKKTKIATLPAVEATADIDVRHVGEAAAEIVSAQPASETASVAASGETVFIPLKKLKKSPRNAEDGSHSLRRYGE